MLFVMVRSGQVQRQVQRVSQEFLGHKRKPLLILDLLLAMKALNCASRIEMVNFGSVTVTVMIQEQFAANDDRS